MAFIDDDVVEGFYGYFGVVDDFLLFSGNLWDFVRREVIGTFVDGVIGEERIHSLDGADAYIGGWVDGGSAETLNVIEFGELTGIVGGRVGHQFLVRLFAQVSGVHQEQDAARPSELEQAIHGGDGGEGLARPRSHVDKRSRFLLFQGFFQAIDGFDLALPQVLYWKFGHVVRQLPAYPV